ncbi:protein kinase domain-containing protein [Nannocystaceae bacterium ST9]
MLRRLRESGHSRVFEAESEIDGRRVIAKVFDLEPQDHEGVEDRVVHEFELIRRLDVAGVVEARELRRVGDQLVLLLEHVSGIDLGELADGRPLELARFWPIAIQVADILAQTHARKVIHRDIKPTNVLIDDAGKVHLADFGISVLLESERRHLYDDSLLVGTLPYISPEQTGRTNRPVDFRSDLYSLGVTFYQLLTGRLPFEARAPLELIHAHLARVPEPANTLRPELPDALSRAIARLLAKAPEHRYQTAAGLASDLRQIRAQVEAGESSDDFELGHDDLSTRLQLPHQLVGREREQSVLVDEYRAVVESGARRALLLTGPTGIGKSALTEVLEVAVAGEGAYLIRGKFDAVHQLPYAGFVEALRALCEQLLTESDARLARWRRRLIEGLAGTIASACMVVPTLALIVGEQAPAPELGLIEARNRIELALERLIATFCEPGRPLVLVLDDLQHADRSSMSLFESLLQTEIGPLLLVATVRTPGPDLGERLAERAPRERIATLALAPLTRAAVQRLLALALVRPPEQVERLAALVTFKTLGVPLFVGQLLADLVERGVLRPEANRWVWDEAAVAASHIPDDAVEMMSGKLDALPRATRELLGRAACLGPRFDLAGLTLVGELPRARVVALVHELCADGLLAELGIDYRFAHDSLRAAALRQLPEDRRRRLHWMIGQRRRAALGEGDDELFATVDHLDAGAPDELDDAARRELAGLDLRAGRRALDSAAYEMARRYFAHALALVADVQAEVARVGPSAPDYALVFELHFAHAQALALALEREAANAAFAELLGWRLAEHHHARVIARRIRLLFVEARPREALELGLQALAGWGYAIPRAPSKPRALHGLVRAWWWLRSLDRAALMAIPACTDELQAAIVEVVAQIKYPAFATNRILFIYLAGLHARMLADHGFHPSTPGALADLAVGVSGGLGKVGDAIALIDHGLALCERLPSPQLARFGVLVPGGVLAWHRGRPFAEIVRLLERNYPEALECGDLDHASFMAALWVTLEVEVGTHLGVLDRRARELGRDVGRWGSKSLAANIWVQRSWSSSLLATPLDPDDPDACDVREIDPAKIEARGGIETTQNIQYVNLAHFRLLLGERERVIADNLGSARERGAIMGSLWLAARLALIMVVAIEGQRLSGRGRELGREARAVVRWGLGLLRRWAEQGPDNYGHYHDLALGMRTAAQGRFDRALILLDRAWASARRRGCRWVEGLAAECSAELLERRGLPLLVVGAWRRAWDAYAAWGASAKLDQLRKAKPELFAELASPARGPSTPSRGTDSSARSTPNSPASSSSRLASRPGSSPGSSSASLDLEGVLRSVGVITEELGLDVVVARVLDAALTSAGADHGMLLLEREGELSLAATRSQAGEHTLIREQVRLRDAGERAPSALINFVVRTNQWLVLDDARSDPRFAGDPYLIRHDVRSMLALPIIKANRQLGVLVLENRLSSHGFTSAIIETLRLITGQAASILDNARLYAALRRSEARWRSLVDGAPDVIALLDEAGSVAFCNRRGPFADLQPGEDSTGESSTGESSLSESSRLRWRESVESVLAQGRARELELALELPEGGRSWYAVRIAPVEPEGEREGARRNAVAVATDISDRKRAEHEKHALEVQLRQQQRLESLGTLASGVAHEINNPIQGIMNYAELIEANASVQTMVEEFAHEITHESERVATIVRNLLAFSRQEAERQQDQVEVGRMIEATLSLIRSVLRKDHIVLGVALGSDPILVRCHTQQIQQILMNLVTNARDAVNQRHGLGDDDEGRKRIDIAVTPIEREGRAWVRVSVADNGPGIPADVLPRIFDPFFTTKGRDQGTGLGLAVSHGLANDNGGELSVETRVDEGSRFALELPCI